MYFILGLTHLLAFLLPEGEKVFLCISKGDLPSYTSVSGFTPHSALLIAHPSTSSCSWYHMSRYEYQSTQMVHYHAAGCHMAAPDGYVLPKPHATCPGTF